MADSIDRRLASFEARIEAVEKLAEETAKAAKSAAASAIETHDTVKALGAALLERQPGHNKNLLERIATVVIQAEQGAGSLRVLFWIAGGLATLGAAVGAAATWLRTGG
jgi:hypothetical protein